MTDERPQRALIIMAHPDDPEFFCGGTVATWTAAGCEAVYVIITNGNKGSSDLQMTSDRLIALRQTEQRAAAAILGVRDVIFLGYNDGELMPTMQVREDLVYQIRFHKPDTVICQDPTAYFVRNNRINHPDHRAAGEAVLAAVFPLARDRLNFLHHEAQGLTAHNVKFVYVAGANEPDCTVDVTGVIERKIEAILAHTSQIAEPAALPARIKERLLVTTDNGRERYLESFRRLDLS